MIWETRREEEGLLTLVGDRESWGKDTVHCGILHLDLITHLIWGILVLTEVIHQIPKNMQYLSMKHTSKMHPNLHQERDWISTFLEQNLHMAIKGSYQVSGVLCLWRVAGVEAVPGCALWAGAGWLSWAQALWKSRPKSAWYLKVGRNKTLHSDFTKEIPKNSTSVAK